MVLRFIGFGILCTPILFIIYAIPVIYDFQQSQGYFKSAIINFEYWPLQMYLLCAVTIVLLAIAAIFKNRLTYIAFKRTFLIALLSYAVCASLFVVMVLHKQPCF